MPSFEPRFSINMQTSLPGQVTPVDQDSPARQIGCGGKGESFRTISAAFPPRSGFVQPLVQAGRAKNGAPLNFTLGLRTVHEKNYRNSYCYRVGAIWKSGG